MKHQARTLYNYYHENITPRSIQGTNFFNFFMNECLDFINEPKCQPSIKSLQ